MPNPTSNNAEIADCVNLLVSLLIHHPAIGTISISPANSSLNLKFMLSAIPKENEFSKITELLLASITAYNVLEGSSIEIYDIDLKPYNQVAMLTIIRDIKTISNNEIALITALLQEHLASYLIIDPNDSLGEEDLTRQEEVIENMLDNLRYHKNMHPLIGVRENGRVLIFNKSS